MLPDGYWDMDTAAGVVGAVLLLPSTRPSVYGLMIPELLSKLFLTAEPGSNEDTKIQRNAQVEILAIVTGILTWTNVLKGEDVLIVTDSSATQGYLLGGSSPDAHLQELVAFLWYIITAFDIQVWVQWLPSEQNPGKPFSRPLTHKTEASEIVATSLLSGLRPSCPLLWSNHRTRGRERCPAKRTQPFGHEANSWSSLLNLNERRFVCCCARSLKASACSSWGTGPESERSEEPLSTTRIWYKLCFTKRSCMRLEKASLGSWWSRRTPPPAQRMY